MAESYGLVLCHDIKKTDSGYELNEQTRERTDTGINLLKERRVGKLIMSGGCEHLYGITIASLMKKYAIEMGVNSEDIIEEGLSRDTAGQLIFSKIGIIDAVGVKKIIIISHEYHLPRIKSEANFIFGNEYELSFLGVAGPDERNGGAELERKSLEAFIRTFKGIKCGDSEKILSRLLEQHNFYKAERKEFLERLEILKDS
ncbi:YdcF family protein [Candidatus Pacearchaeota archaeon]|nr:YdcF family protein [Candidatus Pacearchaeota archaeon]